MQYLTLHMHVKANKQSNREQIGHIQKQVFKKSTQYTMEQIQD